MSTNARRATRLATPDDTQRFGAELASRLAPGSVVTLSGELGSGKTTLVRGIVAGLGGVGESVSSPTFGIVHEYDTPVARVFHVDAFRIERESELDELGFDDYFADEGIVIVEWPERVERRLPDAIRVRLRHDEDGGRSITVFEPVPRQ